MSQSVLAIGEFSVRQLNGLFSLNDLHRAAGSAKRHEPNRFIRLANTQELVSELGASPEMGIPLQVINDGENNGTYACRELVIAYAAWISAAFHLKVIRVFLASTDQPRTVNPALDYTRITPAQAQDLKELVHTIVESGVQGFGETWRRLHNKFRVNSYLELPASRFNDARDYLLGKLTAKTAMPKIITPATQPLKRRRYLTLVDGTSLPQTSEIGDDQHVFSTAELCSHIENEVLARSDLQAIARAVCNLTLRKAGADGAHSFERIQA